MTPRPLIGWLAGALGIVLAWMLVAHIFSAPSAASADNQAAEGTAATSPAPLASPPPGPTPAVSRATARWPLAAGGSAVAVPLPSAYPSPSPRPFTLPVSAGTDGVDPAFSVHDFTIGQEDAPPTPEHRVWASAAVRSINIMLAGLSQNHPAVLDAVTAQGAQAWMDANGEPSGVDGSPTYYSASVFTLSQRQQDAITQAGAPAGDSAAVVLTVRGPVRLRTTAGVTGFIVDGTEPLLLAGHLVHDPVAGDVWNISFTYDCATGGAATSGICSGT